MPSDTFSAAGLGFKQSRKYRRSKVLKTAQVSLSKILISFRHADSSLCSTASQYTLKHNTIIKFQNLILIKKDELFFLKLVLIAEVGPVAVLC